MGNSFVGVLSGLLPLFAPFDLAYLMIDPGVLIVFRTVVCALFVHHFIFTSVN
jgi:hypothetical protein